MRIAIASSGLGHVARGIETWACDTAGALHQWAVRSEQCAVDSQQGAVGRKQSEDIKVTLFCAAPLPALHSLGDAGPTADCLLSTVILPSLKRGNPKTQQLSNWFPKWAWRWGLKSTYDLEQWSFWWHLWPKLRRGKFDIVHVQDPWLARLLDVSRRRGLHRAKVILAHGTEEPLEFLETFEYVQHLAPWHLSEARKALRCRQSTVNSKQWTALPNFVDCAVFHPVHDPVGKATLRSSLGLPPDAFIVGCVAAVKKDHKRLDYLIREFRQHAVSRKQLAVETGLKTDPHLSASHCELPTAHCPLPPPFLLIAGAKTNETPELLALAESLIPGHYKIVPDCPRSRMPDLYRAMDVFVLTSLFEMMPIALLEALASGLPCLVNTHPVLEWMIGAGEETVGSKQLAVGSDQTEGHVGGALCAATGSGGAAIDMSLTGGLSAALAGLTPEWVILHGRQARERAVQMFSAEAVIDQYVAYYKKILSR
ncbi:MAG: glycosyltransferase family 4 protein [bacterium]